MSSYDVANAKFNEVNSNSWTIFDYNTEQNFSDRVDVSVAGVIMDCGECHVGGGGMEFVPASSMAARTSLRDIAKPTADVNGDGPIAQGRYTAFNYFIDTMMLMAMAMKVKSSTWITPTLVSWNGLPVMPHAWLRLPEADRTAA